MIVGAVNWGNACSQDIDEGRGQEMQYQHCASIFCLNRRSGRLRLRYRTFAQSTKIRVVVDDKLELEFGGNSAHVSSAFRSAGAKTRRIS